MKLNHNKKSVKISLNLFGISDEFVLSGYYTDYSASRAGNIKNTNQMTVLIVYAENGHSGLGGIEK